MTSDRIMVLADLWPWPETCGTANGRPMKCATYPETIAAIKNGRFIHRVSVSNDERDDVLIFEHAGLLVVVDADLRSELIRLAVAARSQGGATLPWDPVPSVMRAGT